MKFIVCKDYDEMSRKGAEIIAALLPGPRPWVCTKTLPK